MKTSDSPIESATPNARPNVQDELVRLGWGIDLLEQLRGVFARMSDDGERDRAWTYLSDRFPEFEDAYMPAWEHET